MISYEGKCSVCRSTCSLAGFFYAAIYLTMAVARRPQSSIYLASAHIIYLNSFYSFSHVSFISLWLYISYFLKTIFITLPIKCI